MNLQHVDFVGALYELSDPLGQIQKKMLNNLILDPVRHISHEPIHFMRNSEKILVLYYAITNIQVYCLLLLKIWLFYRCDLCTQYGYISRIDTRMKKITVVHIKYFDRLFYEIYFTIKYFTFDLLTLSSTHSVLYDIAFVYHVMKCHIVRFVT